MPSTAAFQSGNAFRAFIRDLPSGQERTRPRPPLAQARPPLAKALPRQFGRRVARFAHAKRNLAVKAVAIGLISLAAVGLLAQFPVAAPVREAPPPPPAPVWLEIAKPVRVYDLPAPSLAHEKLDYAARRHATGGGREDLLTFGEFAGKRPFLRLSVYRHGAEKVGAAKVGAEKAADPPFFVDMARRAAPLGLSLDHMQLEQTQVTRFGDLETAALTLSEKNLARENCRGFRLVRAEPGLTLAGLACAAGSEPLSAQDMACLVDRLDLLNAGADRPLRDFFGGVKARRMGACGEIARRR
ncbi:hypothetical protein [Rhodoblastus sp.]|uniref:hypothetical protein n=1 Tax=Rhodoblastus sp. TaxID=1962975 RepID=UPI003F99FD5A